MKSKFRRFIALAAFSCLAFVGKSMATNTYSPDQTPNLMFWFEPSIAGGAFQDTGTVTPAVANGDPIGHLVDLSGNGNDVTQSSATERPTIATNVAILNGKTVSLFNGTNNFMQFASSNVLNNLAQQDYTFFVVWVSTNMTQYNTFLNKSTGSSGPLWFLSGHINSGDIFPGRWEKARSQRGVQVNAPYSMGYRMHITINNPTTDLITSEAVFTGVHEEVWLNGETQYKADETINGNGSDNFIYTTTACVGGVNNGNGGSFMTGYIAVEIMYNRYLTDNEMKQVNAYISAKYAVPMRFNDSYYSQTKRDLILCDGDSLTEGHLSTLTQNYPHLLQTVYRLNADIRNDGIGGQQLATPTFNATQRADPFLKTSAMSFYPFLIGSNDLAANLGAVTYYNNLVTWCQARRAAGWKVGVMTVLSRAGALTNGQTIAGFEADRETANALTRANWPTFADALIDTGSNTDITINGVSIPVSNIGAPTAYSNLTYFQSDQVHLTNAGYAILAQAVANTYFVLQPASPSGNFTNGDANKVVNKTLPFLH